MNTSHTHVKEKKNYMSKIIYKLNNVIKEEKERNVIKYWFVWASWVPPLHMKHTFCTFFLSLKA